MIKDFEKYGVAIQKIQACFQYNAAGGRKSIVFYKKFNKKGREPEDFSPVRPENTRKQAFKGCRSRFSAYV